MRMKRKQNAWDVRIVAVGGLVPILLIVTLGLLTGLVTSLLVYWVLSMRVCLSGPECESVELEVILHSGDIV